MSDDRSFCDRLLDCFAQLCCCADTSIPIGTQPRASTVSTAPLTVSPRTGSRYDVESGRGNIYPTRTQHVTPIIHQPRADFQNRRTSSRNANPVSPFYTFPKFVTPIEEQQPKVKRTRELPDIHGNLSLGPSTSRQQEKIFPQELLKPELVTDTVDENDSAFSKFDESASTYREQAQLYFKRSKEFFEKAKSCNRNNRDFYLRQAKKHRKLGEQANHFAAAAFLEENGRKHREDTIDLHHLYVKEALQALDIFLDNQIFSLQKENLQTKSLSVITGWGKHNVNGVARIKPAVMDRLRERGLRFFVINPGNLKVKIFVHSHLTNDLPEV